MEWFWNIHYCNGHKNKVAFLTGLCIIERRVNFRVRGIKQMGEVINFHSKGLKALWKALQDSAEGPCYIEGCKEIYGLCPTHPVIMTQTECINLLEGWSLEDTEGLTWGP